MIIDRIEASLAKLRESNQTAAEPQLVSPRALCVRAPENVRYLTYPFAVPGMLSLLDGMPKLAGKTTLLLTGIAAVFRQNLFLNHATQPCRILYVTEEGQETFSIALRKAGLDALESGMVILSNHEMFGWSWERKVKFIEKTCREQTIDWLILDTFFDIVGFPEEKENDAAAVHAAAPPLRQITSQLKCAVTLTRHERKSGGEVGTSGRGSNALAGTVDIIARVRRLPGNRGLQKREIEIISRIENAKLNIELRRDTNDDIVASREDIWESETAETESPLPSDLSVVLGFVLAAQQQGVKPRRVDVRKGVRMKTKRVNELIEIALKRGLLAEDHDRYLNCTKMVQDVFPNLGNNTPTCSLFPDDGNNGNTNKENAGN